MSLVKVAFMSHREINAAYDDNRSFMRKNKGKILGYTIGLPVLPWGPFAGHVADWKRKERDFVHRPSSFKKIEPIVDNE